MVEDLKKYIRDVHDFPKEGIIFKDITPLLGDKEAFGRVVDFFAHRYKDKGIDHIIGIESRGFIFGAAVAARMGLGFVPVRKPNKLPYLTYAVEYELEYGRDAVEIHEDALERGSRVVVMDDLLATGGTAAATLKLLKNFNAQIEEVAFVIELGFLKGREQLKDNPVYAIMQY